MAQINAYLDPVGNILTLYWDLPTKDVYSEETEDPNRNDVVIKNKLGVPIGVEIIGVFPAELNIVKLLRDRGLIKSDQHQNLLESKFI